MRTAIWPRIRQTLGRGPNITPPRSARISPHFTRTEFDCADGTQSPEGWIVERLTPLCDALEVIRGELTTATGRACRVTITSGYRSPEYNARVGGVKRSLHVSGYAADLVVYPSGEWTPIAAARVATIISQLMLAGRLPQSGLGYYETFTHYDVRGLCLASPGRHYRSQRFGPAKPKGQTGGRRKGVT